MKLLAMPATITALLYGAQRSDIIAYTILAVFLLSGSFLIFYSLYRHFAANRLL